MSSSRESKPIFGIKKREITARLIKQESGEIDPNRLFSELVLIYHHAVLKALLTCFGTEVIAIENGKPPKHKNCHIFVRDPVLIFNDLNLMFFTEGNKPFGAMDIVAEGEKRGYKAEEIADAYFEEGNTLYSTTQKVLFHGLQPGGHYFLKVNTLQTTQKLKEKLASHGIAVYGLKLNSNLFKNVRGLEIVTQHYYHLDCFMQLLPNGRLVILNQKLLSKESIAKLKEIFGKDFVDLAYADYLAKPVLFNFFALQNDNKIIVISPELPASLLKFLRDLDLVVITPNMLDARDPNYDSKLSEKVAKELQKEGYTTASTGNLAIHLPANDNGYPVDDGRSFSPFLLNMGDEHGRDKVDKVYCCHKISFTYGSVAGGPHCVIADILPNVVKREQSLASTKSTLFVEEFKSSDISKNSTLHKKESSITSGQVAINDI